jgi:TolB-like protein/class 3 adenylate cyclase/Tfp pilus assembly protein PilF
MDNRQLAAIMFTDIVGYSALTERNEVLALDILEKHWALLRPVFTRFGGHEIKTIGDAFLIEFPSALRAVEAGLAMQTTLDEYNHSVEEDHRIHIRIGIHLGDVERREDDVFGDGVNIASRIESLAAPGGLCISESVYASVRNKIDVSFHSMGERELKNISQPIVVYSNRPHQKATIIKSNFWEELRRRNVFKVGVTYAILAWLLMQLTVIAAPALQLPGWTLSLITYILIIGFPLILLFAWAFELTPEGFKPTHQVQDDESITSMTGRKFDFIIIGLLLVAVIFLVLHNYVLVEEASPPKITIATGAKTETIAETPVVADRKSIAVLPFANRSKSEDDAFFVDGVHDDILTQLAKIASLKVISRTSVMGYRGTTKNMKTIGGELGVATLLEGGIQRAGSRVRINMQLIDVDTDEHLWAETYNKELTATNIFEIQEQIATEIANALRATLSPEEQARIAAVPTKNLAALEAYFHGRQRMVGRTSDGLAHAVDYFGQAVALDPDFALAYVGLSVVYQLQIDYSGLPIDKMQAKAEATINKALALDDKSGEAYASLGLLKQNRNDLDGAEVAYKKALALNPNYAAVYNWYGNLKSEQDKPEEALAVHRQGAEIDPLSVVLNSNIAFQLTSLGRFHEALAQHEKTITIAPASPMGYANKAYYYWSVSGQLDEAARWLRTAHSLDSKNPQFHAFIAYLYRDLGDATQAECWTNRAIELAPENIFSNEAMQLVYVQRADETRALEYAHKVLNIGSPVGAMSLSLATLRNHDVQVGNYNDTRVRYAKIFPELLADEPRIGSINLFAAIDLAAVLQLTGENERADSLFNNSLAYIQGKQQIGDSGYGIRDVHIYALQGKTQQALTALRQAIDAGWRSNWRYDLEHNPNLDSIRNAPEFQTMLAEIKAEMAEQLARVKEMEKEGDVCVKP